MAVTTVSISPTGLQNGTYANTDGVPDIINIEVAPNIYFNLTYSNAANSPQNFSYAWLSTRTDSTGEHVANPAFAINQTFNSINRALIFKVADNKVVVITSTQYQFYTYDLSTMRVVANSAIKTHNVSSSSFNVNYRQNYVYQHSYTKVYVGYNNNNGLQSNVYVFNFDTTAETMTPTSVASIEGSETMYCDYGFVPVFNSNGKMMMAKTGTQWNASSATNINMFLFPENGINGTLVNSGHSSYGGRAPNHAATTYIASRIIDPTFLNTTIIVAQNNIEWVSVDASTNLRVQIPGATTSTGYTLTTDSGNVISSLESGLQYPGYRNLVWLDENHLMQVCLGFSENPVTTPANRTFTQRPNIMNIRFIERQTPTRWVVSERTRFPLQVTIPPTVMIGGTSTNLLGFESGNCGLEFVNNEWVLRFRVGGRRHTFKIT